MNRLLPIITLFIVAFLFSCKKDSKEQAEAYFGGEIINPKEKHIILFKDEKPIDTILLDKNNRFYYSFKKLQPGLYSFVHSEFQYVHIEPQDSLFLRLNTLEFDETLTFTGKGALKNNFLIKSFLKNEKSSEKLHEAIYHNCPNEFKKTIKQELKRRRKNLEQYSDKYNFSESFTDIARVNIDYHYYTLLEKYPMYNRTHKDSIDRNYYAYRENTNLNKKEYISLYPYWNYLYSFTDNVTKEIHSKEQKNNYHQDYLLNFCMINIKTIDSLIEEPELKNMVLNRTAKNFITKTSNEEAATTILDFYSKYNTSKENKEKLLHIVANIKQLKKGKPIPSIKIANINNDNTDLKSIINKPSVIYFWSSKYPNHLKSVQKKVSDFSKGSNYSFIGISIDDNQVQWQETVKKYNLPNNNEYIFVNQKKATDKLLIHQIHKIFVLDKNGSILNSELNIFDPQFKNQLESLQKGSLTKLK